MRSEHLELWLASVTRKERPDTSHWDRDKDIIHTEFRYGRILDECT